MNLFLKKLGVMVMNVFDYFLSGNTEDIDWCFENTHFIQRLNDNRISREFIVNTILYEEPLRYERSGNNQYEVIYNAPETKNYKEIKVIFACNENSIDLVTIIPIKNTNRQKNIYKSEKYKKLEKDRIKAISKRKGSYL